MVADSQLNFDYLLGQKQMFRIRDAAKILGLSERFVEKLFDSGQLYGHQHNAEAGERMTKTIVRESLQAYLVRQATYDARMRHQAIREILNTLTREERLHLRNFLTESLAA